MSDPSSQAKLARETLARALGAAQSDPSAPAHLMNIAEPVSQAMGALFQIERSQSLATAGAARDHVRTALGMLQTDTSQHPAVATAMDSVANSLGLIFGLVKLAEAAGAPAPAQAYAPQAAQPVAPQAAPQPGYQAAPQPAAYQAPAPAAYQAPPQAAAPQAAPYQAPPQAAPPQAPAPVAAAAPSNLPKYEAALGTSSPSNFYKGLSGNDVVEHGGLFVSTYAKVPAVGAQVSLKVILPGGYEFDSVAVIQWIRDSGGSDSTPGFGARFTQITAEHKQLVYRYVKNREPIFHDDF